MMESGVAGMRAKAARLESCLADPLLRMLGETEEEQEQHIRGSRAYLFRQASRTSFFQSARTPSAEGLPCGGSCASW